MRILITGSGGFVGSSLVRHLATAAPTDVEVHGTVFQSRWRLDPIRHAVRLHQLDLREAEAVVQLIRTVCPDLVFHLAAQSNAFTSSHNPWLTYEANIRSQLNLLEALLHWQPNARVLIASSNEVYGLIQPEELPLNESAPCRPLTPYGVTKVAQEVMAQQYWRRHHLSIVVARSFNHIGAGQADGFVASTFARQLAEIEAGKREPVIRVGNLDVERDFSDVRDVVSAYWLLLNQGEAGHIYNVGSGTALPIRRILDILLRLVDLKVQIVPDLTRTRTHEIPKIVCDNGKLVARTHWAPYHDLDTTLFDVLSFWRSHLDAGLTSLYR